jgi:hypothetical protein
MKFKLWVSKDYKCGAIYLVSSWTISRPQEDRALMVHISGNMTQSSPLKLNLNESELLIYLQQRRTDDETIQVSFPKFCKLMKYLDSFIHHMTVEQDSQNFVHDLFI